MDLYHIPVSGGGYNRLNQMCVKFKVGLAGGEDYALEEMTRIWYDKCSAARGSVCPQAAVRPGFGLKKLGNRSVGMKKLTSSCPSGS